MTDRLELGTAAAIVSLAVVNTISTYRDAAPKLSDLRNAAAHDHEARQLLLDADIFGGIMVVLIGGGAALLSKRMLPLVMAASGLLLVSLYYRSVLASATPADVLGVKPDDKEGNSYE